MLENQEGTTPVEPTIEELKATVARLERELGWARDARDHNGKKLDEVREFIQASIDNDDWTDSELDEPFWEELAELLDLEISKTIEVIITAEWSATLKMKRGQDLSDVEISVEEPELSRFASGELTDVYERSFDVSEA
jgi:hypothetical protein